MKKLLVVLLVLILCVGVFAGCGSDNGSDANASTNTPLTDEVFFTGKTEFLTADNEAVFNIIRPDGDDTVRDIAQKLFKQFKDVIGVTAKNQTDSSNGTDKYEILIGNTNRSETAVAKTYLKEKTGGRYDDFIVCTIEKKIVIYSQSFKGLQSAADYFVKNYLKKEGFSGGIAYCEAAKGEFKDVKINNVNVSNFKIIRPHFNLSYLVHMEIENLIDTVYTTTGYKLEYVHDEYAKASDYEIIVGNAGFDGVEAVTDVDSYKVTVSGKKVYLNGGSAHATAMAVSEFTKLLTADVTDSASKTGSYNDSVKNYDKNTLKYAWGDDFNGDALDTSKWYQSTMKESGTKGENGKTSVRSDNPNDVFVNDGKFHICARQDELYYYGGRITSQKTMRYKYGYLEMSAVLPHGSDFWVALWACGDAGQATADQMNMYSEIDVVECFGNSAMYYANCHSWPTMYGEQNGLVHTSLDDTHANEKKYQCPDSKRLTETFHTYGMMWTPDAMTFVCDADPYFTYNFRDDNEDKNTFNQEMYLIISMALGFDNNSTSINDATAEDWEYTNKYIVDWVNIYQKDDGKSYVTLK